MPVRNPRTLIILAALGLAAGPAVAAPKPAAGKAEKSSPAPKARIDLNAVRQALESGDEAKALAALETVAQSGEPGGAPPIEQLLGRGASSKLLLRAVETLGILAQPSSGAALVPYAQHRNPELRRAALRALIATKSPLAAEVLRRALHGNDPGQRAIAARGLGELNVRAAVPELFSVLPKDVAEAAQSIGLLCVQAECEKFMDLLGRLRFEVMESGIVPILSRPAADVPDPLKLKLIERLRRMATQPATQLLQAALAKFPADGSPRVKTGLERALKGYSAEEETK
jgi:HEAT repeat protein